MTPQEKAKELYKKYYDPLKWVRESDAKQYATWAVEEILSELKEMREEGNGHGVKEEYWTSVLEEIRNI